MILNNTDPELKALLTRRLYECYGWQGNSTNSHDDYKYRITTESVTLRNAINANTNNDTELYCRKVFDAYLCWPETKAGIVANQLCPDFVEGFNKYLFAHKTCLENDEWYGMDIQPLIK